MKTNIHKNGLSLVELIISISIFSIVVASLSYFSIDAYRGNENASKRIVAANMLQEITYGLISIKNNNWASIINNTGGMKRLVYSNNKYSLEPGNEVKDGFTISITIEPVFRDNNDNIVFIDGSLDARTRAVNISVSWSDISNQTQTLESKLFINNWNSYTWKQTTKSDFDLGTYTSTVSNTNGDGEVQLQVVAYPDWCKPTLSLSSMDLPGSAIATSVQAIEGEAFIGTGSGSSSINFMDIGISNTQPPIASVSSTYTGNKANTVFGESNFAYLATESDTKEVIILDITGSTPIESGYFNAPGTANGKSIYVKENKGYLTTIDNKLYIFDLSSKAGSRPQLGVKTLMGEGSEVQIVGNYAYVSLTGGAHVELQVLDITNPANIVTTGVGNTSQSDASDLFIDPTGSRAYVGTASSSTEKEFIIFDTSNKPATLNQVYFQESGGSVSIEAENFHSNISRSGKTWVTDTSNNPTGASGSTFITASPDTGSNITSDYFNTSPELGYRVKFTNTGTYYFWVRAYANNSGNNNIHGGYDGANYPNIESISTTNYNSWRWFRGSIDITTAEMHWINVWMQDDGFRLDKIYLTTNSSYTPTGTGPAESAIVSENFLMPSIHRQLGQYETSGMSINGITVVEDNTRAILVGTGGQEYQVLNIENESNPVKCGGLDINSGINSISSVKENDSDAYSYIITRETGSEFRIIRGGPGDGGVGPGTIYAITGSYISQIFDTGSTFTTYLNLKPKYQKPTNTNIQVQVRTGDTIPELNTNNWFGSDGTAATYFTEQGGSFIPITTQGKRYIQFLVLFSSDSNDTPRFESLEIDYQL